MPSSTQLKVSLILPDGSRQPVTLPANVEIERLIPALVSKLELPTVDEAGQALQYELQYAGEAIPVLETLVSHGVAVNSDLEFTAAPLQWAGSVNEPAPIRIERAEAAGPVRVRRQPSEPEPAGDRAARWVQRNWGAVLVVGFIVLRLINGLADEEPPPVVQLPPSLPTVPLRLNLDRATPVPVTPTPSIDSSATVMERPIVLDKALYFFREDELGYALWRVDLDDERFPVARIMTVSPVKEPTFFRVVRDNVLFFEAAGDEVWYLPAGSSTPRLFPASDQLTHAPIQVHERFVYRQSGWSSYEPLIAYQNDDLNREIREATTRAVSGQPIDLILDSGDGTQMTGQTAAGLSQGPTWLELPVSVSVIWHHHTFEQDGVLYFSGWDEQNGLELWRTDGTVTGTYLVRDINEGQANSHPADFIAAHGYIYFTVETNNSTGELWRTDGTSEGTIQVADLNGMDDGLINDMTVVGDQLFFTGLEEGQFLIFRIREPDSPFAPISMPEFSEIRLKSDGITTGTTTTHHVSIGLNANAHSFLILQLPTGAVAEAALFNYDGILQELFVSDEMVLVQSSSLQVYRFDVAAVSFRSIRGAPLGGQVLPYAEGQFLFFGNEDEIFLLSPDADEVQRIVALDG